MPNGSHSPRNTPRRESRHDTNRREVANPLLGIQADRTTTSGKRPVVIKESTDLSSGKAGTAEVNRNVDDHASRQTAFRSNPSKPASVLPPTSDTPRPFSPSALASRSGKTFKAFFRHRPFDDDTSRASIATHVTQHRTSSRSDKGGSIQVKQQEAVKVASISHVEEARHIPEKQGVQVRFPQVGQEETQKATTDDNLPKRKTRHSFSLFRSVSKSKPVAKISPPPLLGPVLVARSPSDTLRKQRPVSAPAPKRREAATDHKDGIPERILGIKEAPPLSLHHSQTAKTSVKIKHASAPVKTIRLKPDEPNPEPPDRCQADTIASPRLLSLTSPQSAMTSIAGETTSDPDREAHYLLRMACTYLTKTIMPEVKMSRRVSATSTLSPQPISASSQQYARSASEKADALRIHVYDKIKLLERMERAWGIDWMLRGKDGFTISDSRKEKERDCFRSAVENGVVLCFLLLRLENIKPTGGLSIVLSSASTNKDNLALASDMTCSLNFGGEDADLPAPISQLGGKGVYAAAQLIIALARSAGPHQPVPGIEGINTSNPTSEDEEAAPAAKRLLQPSKLTLAFQKPVERPPLIIRRLSSKSSTSGASTPKQLEPIKLPHAEPNEHGDSQESQLTSDCWKENLFTKTQALPSLPSVTHGVPSQPGAAGPLLYRRPILRVKQSFASSVTSGNNTSTADSKSRASGWHPRVVPEERDDIMSTASGIFSLPQDVPTASSPTRTVSFGLSDEHAQHQVKTFRSQTRYRVRGAKPKFSQESLSGSEIAVADEGQGLPTNSISDQHARSQDMVDDHIRPVPSLLSSPRRRQFVVARPSTPQRTSAPTNRRPSSAVSITPISPLVFPGTPPRTPRNHSGVLPQSLAGSRRTSYASSNGESSTHRYSRQIIEVALNGDRKASYQIGNCIGKGQFGMVFRALDLSSGQFVAIKRIDIRGTKGDEVGQIMREVDLLQRLKHPGIVRYLGMARNSDSLDIVLEFIEGGSLAHSVKSFGQLNEELVAGYVGKILEGLNYLHAQDVVHCDLKAANILTTKTGNIKLSDFGVSLNLRAVGRPKEDVVGSPNWMAPEVIELKGITTAADIWSLGATVIELITGKPPYHDMDNGMAVMYRIVDEEMAIPETCSPDLEDFLTKCFRKNPRDRPSAEELFEHEWVKSRMNLDPDLQHHDSIPFLRRISTDAFKLHAERIILDPSSPAAQVEANRQPNAEGNNAKILPLQRSALPSFDSSQGRPLSLASINGEKGVLSDATAQVRQRTFDTLSGKSPARDRPRIPTKPESRSRLFSLSRQSSRKSHEPTLPNEKHKEQDVQVGVTAAVTDRLLESPLSGGAPGWLSASSKPGFVSGSHSPPKRNDAKSDCNIM